MTALEDANLRRYYDQRAPEYEQIYLPRDDAHGRELGELARELRTALEGRRVLEVACGTAYWTACAAKVVRAITATDVSLAMLAEAREKALPANVTVRWGDAYDLAAIAGEFDGALAMFWLSHVPRARLRTFLDGLHACLLPGSIVYLADNVHVPGVGGELLPVDASSDTYKLRRLADGGRHRVLKNYFSERELADLLTPGTSDLTIRMGHYFWSVRYRIASAPRV
ncbi:MAG TPA: class I SAM-dependent methyltransferase [Myxococcales bacterium]|nr:class I SAM-dependent methyltransferase [Myxococcales bacterium]